MQYVTAKDILIPAGTPLLRAPTQTRRTSEFAQALVAVTNDSTADLTMHTEEALEAGWIRPIER